MQAPFIAGVGGGVGTTALATALGARDCGVYRAGTPVHVLVCRSTLHSVGAAQRALQHTPWTPVLAVVADGASGGIPSNAAHGLRMAEAHVFATVEVPFVSHWRDVERPYDDAATVLVAEDDELSRGLRAYAGAAHALVAAIVELDRDVVPRPGAPDLPDVRDVREVAAL